MDRRGCDEWLVVGSGMWRSRGARCDDVVWRWFAAPWPCATLIPGAVVLALRTGNCIFYAGAVALAAELSGMPGLTLLNVESRCPAVVVSARVVRVGVLLLHARPVARLLMCAMAVRVAGCGVCSGNCLGFSGLAALAAKMRHSLTILNVAGETVWHGWTRVRCCVVLAKRFGNCRLCGGTRNVRCGFSQGTISELRVLYRLRRSCDMCLA